jgi:hypothetical protein
MLIPSVKASDVRCRVCIGIRLPVGGIELFGIEPANTGFADLRVSHFTTGAFATTDSDQHRLTTVNCALKIKNPPRLLADGSSGFEILVSESSRMDTPAQRSSDSYKYTSRE